MRTSSKLACVALLLVLGVSFGFGWGSITHVYIANRLGVQIGPLNQNEIYGAVLPDLFGYDFSRTGFTADYALHTSKDLLWGLYFSARDAHAKAGFYGVFTHNNINDPNFANMRGADWFAHAEYPLPGTSPDPDGWVIQQGSILALDPSISEYIATLVPPDYVEYFSLIVGHTLIETAGDILVRRCEDPLVGARLILAGRNRSCEIPQVLGELVSSIPGAPTKRSIVKAELAYRQQMIGYGEIFLLPEGKLIEAIAQQTAALAQTFLKDAFGIDPPPPIDAVKIAGYIRLAIAQLKPVFHQELMLTLHSVEANMQNGPPAAGPPYAFWKDGTSDDDLAEFSRHAEQPAEFALDQNYPNPFNPTTSIAYAVPSDGRVTLKVYNSIGQEVATLVNDDMTAGQYVATWDAAGVASGTYFYRIQAGNTVMTKKMTLLR